MSNLNVKLKCSKKFGVNGSEFYKNGVNKMDYPLDVRGAIRETIYRAKIMAYMIRSTAPEKKPKIERLRFIMNEAQILCDEILETGAKQ